jgi:hypothetical protein
VFVLVKRSGQVNIDLMLLLGLHELKQVEMDEIQPFNDQ